MSSDDEAIAALGDRLARGELVTLDLVAWQAVAAAFATVEAHDTQLRGELLIVRTPSGFAAVEAPRPEQRVVRPLADAEAVRAFVGERLRTYERMWDGCGCRIDYFG